MCSGDRQCKFNLCFHHCVSVSDILITETKNYVLKNAIGQTYHDEIIVLFFNLRPLERQILDLSSTHAHRCIQVYHMIKFCVHIVVKLSF